LWWSARRVEYRDFEAAIISDYDAETAVERELVLRLWLLGSNAPVSLSHFVVDLQHLRIFSRRPLSFFQ
jgi:hypothetical protein